MKQYTGTDLDEKINAFLASKMRKFPELQESRETREPRKFTFTQNLRHAFNLNASKGHFA